MASHATTTNSPATLCVHLQMFPTARFCKHSYFGFFQATQQDSDVIILTWPRLLCQAPVARPHREERVASRRVSLLDLSPYDTPRKDIANPLPHRSLLSYAKRAYQACIGNVSQGP